MTVSLWNKIRNCFYFSMKESRQKSSKSNEREGNGFYRHIQQYAENIVVGGWDDNRQVGENQHNDAVIHPPQNLQLDPSSLLSYSAYCCHSASVTRSGSLIGVGSSNDRRISGPLEKTVHSRFTEFSMNGSSGRQRAPVSAVCAYYTKKKLWQLVFCDYGISEGTPVFLDIGNREPVSLFGGFYHAAAICTDGKVIFINRDSVRNSPSSRIDAVSLPGGEKATMVACLNKSVFALSWSGRVFASSIESRSFVLKFSEVSELSGQKVVWLSGSHDRCLAVSSEGRVFGRGSNSCGQLGFEQGRSEVPSFTEISSLSGNKIRAAYAGCCHSLFETREGRVLACGYNYYGQLLLSSGPSDEYVSVLRVIVCMPFSSVEILRQTRQSAMIAINSIHIILILINLIPVVLHIIINILDNGDQHNLTSIIKLIFLICHIVNLIVIITGLEMTDNFRMQNVIVWISGIQNHFSLMRIISSQLFSMIILIK